MPTDSAALRLLPHLRRAALAHDAETGDGPLLASFVANREEAAFAALVRRHGPMVLGVCRRVIGDPHLAEDAFQATFLVLARRAATVRPRHLVGHWLYGVAYRTALKARGVAARRMAKEKQVDAMPHPPDSPDEAWADLQPVLDAELARLPDKYRVPVILCDLGGRPQREVARELRLPPATLANRLAAARRLLAKRLTHRGVALSAGAVAAALGWHAATCAVPPALARTTVRAACAAAGGSVAGLPASVVQLSDGVLRMFVLNKLKAVATGVATGLALLAGIGLMAGPTLLAGSDEKPKKAAPPAKAEASRPADPHRPPTDDLLYLRRTSLDLRGTLPTRLEAHYFLADKDPKKRAKLVEWMLPEHGNQKTTEHCRRCHDVPHGWGPLKDVPHLHHLLDYTTDATPFFAGDFDDNGHLDLYVANRLQRLGVEKAKPTDPEVAAKRAEVEKARAAVQVAEKEVQEIKALTHPDFPAAKDLLKRAQARLDEARMVADAAEQQLKAVTAKAESGRITKDLDHMIRTRWLVARSSQPSDAEFLRRVLLDLTGVPPTTVEEKYFAADPDPNKREKLLGLLLDKGDKATVRDKLIDDLLADPDVRKRWEEVWKRYYHAEEAKAAHEAWRKKSADRLDRLLADLVERKKSDEQVLNALCLATIARFPTETEQNLLLEGIRGQSDRRAAWQGILKALAATEEAKAYAAELAKRGGK